MVKLNINQDMSILMCTHADSDSCMLYDYVVCLRSSSNCMTLQSFPRFVHVVDSPQLDITHLGLGVCDLTGMIAAMVWRVNDVINPACYIAECHWAIYMLHRCIKHDMTSPELIPFQPDFESFPADCGQIHGSQ